MAEARTGIERLTPSTEKPVSVMSGLMVTSPGTMATSSKPNVRLSSLEGDVAIEYLGGEIARNIAKLVSRGQGGERVVCDNMPKAHYTGGWGVSWVR